MVEGPPPRRLAPLTADLVVHRFEPLSVLRFGLGLTIATVVVLVVLVTALYELLIRMGVFDSVDAFTGDIGVTHGSSFVDVGTVVGWTAIAAAGVGVFLAAALTVAAFVYNVVNDLIDGPEATLAESQRVLP